jgi:uncharacterized protein (DUF58 family)
VPSAYVDGPATFRPLSPRNILLLFAAAGTVVGWRLHHPTLLAMAAACWVVVIAAAVEAARLLRGVRATREHQPRAFEEETVPVRLLVESTAGPAVDLVVVEDSFPPSLGHRLKALVTHRIAPGGGVDLRFGPTCDHRRGLYILGPTKLSAADSLGFFQREVFVENFTELIVYPNSVELNEAEVLGDGTLPHVGMELQRRSGYSEEFIGVREWRAGDPMRFVHWRSTARLGHPMVKEFREEITTRVSIFLDLGRLGLVGVGDQTSVEYGIKAAASVARRATALGHEVELFSVGDKVDHLPAGGGAAHLLAMLDRLALVRPQGDSGFLAVVGDIAPSLPRGATAVLILGAAATPGDTLARVVERLVERRILPIAVLIDDRAFVKIFKEQDAARMVALPLEELSRELALRGAVVRVIRKDRTIAQALIQGLERDDASVL